jgi:hypothetical protein
MVQAGADVCLALEALVEGWVALDLGVILMATWVPVLVSMARKTVDMPLVATNSSRW